ncbi:FecR domain-containing protein [Chitinophaga sp. YIM B06452]|uniref:FecR family protein n=1 Tax=Chitinophaga sp. YIM B06452 TaxID=3082158 RepID=UPI0031FF0B94
MDDRLQDLLKRFFEGTVTAAEQQELMELVMASDDAMLEPLMRARWEAMQAIETDAPDGSHILAAILERPTPVRSMRKRWYWAAAAAALLVVSAGGYMLVTKTGKPTVQTAQQFGPGYRHATLVLDDGTVVTLDSNGHRTLQQGRAVVRQQGGQLVYDESGDDGAVTYNTLRTPPGGQFKITLPDGTAVWLNAASSIRYPTAFNGSERRVEITGEAYFEIAQRPEMPFKVGVANKAEVAVLGTDFNVNAYQDEGIIKTTLLQGAISMAAPSGRPALLKPGQQAQLNTANASANIKIINDANIDQAVAWRKGLFNFDHTDLRSVMNELSRWYNVDVRYEGELPFRTFRGKITRNLSLPEVLEVLQDVDIRFRMEGKTIVVYN